MPYLKNLNLHDCVLVEQTSRNLFLYNLRQLRNRSNLNWLNSINLDKLNFYWCSDMDDENGVMGAYSIWTPNNIYLRKFNMNTKEEAILPTLVHELQHKYQYQKLSILYFLVTIPIIRDFTIELLANHYEGIVEDILTNKKL